MSFCLKALSVPEPEDHLSESQAVEKLQLKRNFRRNFMKNLVQQSDPIKCQLLLQQTVSIAQYSAAQSKVVELAEIRER